MENFLVYTFIGLTTAAIYAVIASGLVLTYTTTGVFNFAHGAIGMLAAFSYWQLQSEWHLPTLVAIFIVLFVLAPLFGLVLERGVMRGLGGTSEATRLVVSISLLVGMIGLANVIWDPLASRNVDPFFIGDKVVAGPITLSYHQIVTMLLALAVAGGLRLVLTQSRLGVTMRAVVDDPALASLNGVQPTRVAQFSWAIGSSLAALGGVLIASSAVLNASVLALLIVNAYAAAIFGRLRSLPMTFVGALVLGLVDAYMRGYIPQSDYFTPLHLAAPAIVLFVALLVLPNRRLRTHVRTREYFPAPSLRGLLMFCGVVLLGGVMAATTLSQVDLTTYVQVFSIGIIALSLVPLVGYAGQISLCQLSFAAIGAIVFAHTSPDGGPLGLLVAVVVCAAVGALVALPALRLSGIYMALATAAFAVFLDSWAFNLPDFDIGPVHLGHITVLPHIMHVSIFGLASVNVAPFKIVGYSVATPRAQMVLAAILFVLVTALVGFVRRSRFGTRLIAMRDSEAACATFGLDLIGTRVAVFAVSAAIAGFGGALYGSQLTSVTPDRFNLVTGLPLFMLVVVGGAGFVSAGLFTGVSLNGLFPLLFAVAKGLTKYQLIGTGAAGVGLGREPSGAAPQISEGFTPLRDDAPVVFGFLGLAVVAWGGRLIGLYSNLPFVGLLVFLFVAAVALASRRHMRAAAEVAAARELAEAELADGAVADLPLEWVGVLTPWTPELLARTEEALGLDTVVLPDAPHRRLDTRTGMVADASA